MTEQTLSLKYLERTKQLRSPVALERCQKREDKVAGVEQVSPLFERPDCAQALNVAVDLISTTLVKIEVRTAILPSSASVVSIYNLREVSNAVS